MQKCGREWADALHVHTGRTARWAYMHKAKHHLKRGVVDNGCPGNGDDMVFETKHRKNKLYHEVVFQGGQAEGEQSVVMQQRPKQVVAPADGRGGTGKPLQDSCKTLAALEAELERLSGIGEN